MVQKINPHPAPEFNRSLPYYVFSKDAILGSVPSISSEVLELTYHIYNIFVSSFAISKNAIKLVKATRGSLQGRGVM